MHPMASRQRNRILNGSSSRYKNRMKILRCIVLSIVVGSATPEGLNVGTHEIQSADFDSKGSTGGEGVSATHEELSDRGEIEYNVPDGGSTHFFSDPKGDQTVISAATPAVDDESSSERPILKGTAEHETRSDSNEGTTTAREGPDASLDALHSSVQDQKLPPDPLLIANGNDQNIPEVTSAEHTSLLERTEQDPPKAATDRRSDPSRAELGEDDRREPPVTPPGKMNSASNTENTEEDIHSAGGQETQQGASLRDVVSSNGDHVPGAAPQPVSSLDPAVTAAHAAPDHALADLIELPSPVDGRPPDQEPGQNTGAVDRPPPGSPATGSVGGDGPSDKTGSEDRPTDPPPATDATMPGQGDNGAAIDPPGAGSRTDPLDRRDGNPSGLVEDTRAGSGRGGEPVHPRGRGVAEGGSWEEAAEELPASSPDESGLDPAARVDSRRRWGGSRGDDGPPSRAGTAGAIPSVVTPEELLTRVEEVETEILRKLAGDGDARSLLDM